MDLKTLKVNFESLSEPTADGQFIVATGVGAFQYESGNVARTSLGLGTGDSPTFAGLTTTGSSVLGLNSSVFQPAAGGDSATFFQIKNAAGTVVPLTVDTTNGIINLKANPVFQAAGTQIIKFDGNNTFIGLEAFDNEDGQFNVGIGYQAGYYNDTTGAGIEGDRNIYIGYRAGYGAVSGNKGYQNIAIGRLVLFYNSTGHENVAVGELSLHENRSGNYNFALGKNSLRENTTGSNNVAIGEGAGEYNKTGSANVTIGRRSGRGNDSHRNNVCVGHNSGTNITTGSSNIFFGYKSGYRQTTNSNRFIIDRGLADESPRASVAAEITDSIVYGIMADTPTNQSLRFNVGDLTLASTTPYQTLWNTTHEDSDGGGESRLIFKREDGNTTETACAQIEASHNGAGVNDQLGKIVVSVNTGAGLVEGFRLDSDLVATFVGRLGAGTDSPNAPLEVKGSLPGDVGNFHSGLLHVTNASDSEFANAVITGHNSYTTPGEGKDVGNTQLWYLGSVTSDNDDVAFINRQYAALSLRTNNINRVTVTKDGDVGVDVTDPHSKFEVAGAISSATLTINASSDTLDVSGINTVFVDITGDIILGGLVGGVDGQRVEFALIGNFTNHVRFEHQEGIGGDTQDFINHTSSDEDIDHGGCIYVCNGTNWYDVSHAKHV